MTTQPSLSRRHLIAGAAALGIFPLVGGIAGCRATPEEARSALDRLPAGDPGDRSAPVARFTAQVLQAARTEPANLVMSPFSIQVALSMVRNGAAGRTAEEMDEVLHIGDLAAYNAEVNSLCQIVEARSRQIDKDREVRVELANSLWGQQDLDFAEPFLDALAQYYGAGMTLADFESDAAGAVEAINDWTEERTHGRIPEIVSTDLVTADTRLVLVNALYLKAPWARPFPEAATEDGPFTTGSGEQVEVPMMSGKANRWYADDVCTAARISYAGEDLAMAVVKPKDDIGRVLDDWAGGGLARLVDEWDEAVVDLRMPRWEHDWRGGLAEVLADLGMPIAFSDDADFSAMTAQERLLIGFVEHRATITVDEQGTEAAAATAVGMEPTSAQPGEPEELILDRDFLYVIHDVETGTPLFVGVVNDPTG